MPYSSPLPTELDFAAVRVLMDFARTKEPFGRPVVEAAYNLLGYALNVTVPPRLVGGDIPDPISLDAGAIAALESLSDQESQHQISAGLIPWTLLASWLVQRVIDRWLAGR